MAENKSKGAQHLTSLDLDIDGIIESLKTAEEQIEQYSISSGKKYAENIKKSLSDTTIFNTEKIIDDTQIESAKKKLTELTKELGNFSKVSVKQSGDSLFGNITYDDSIGNKIIAKYELIGDTWEKVSTEQIQDTKKLESVIKSYNDSVEKTLNSLNKLATTREQQSVSLTSKSALEDNQSLLSQIKEVTDALKAGSITVDEAKEKFKELSEQVDYIKFDESAYKSQEKVIESLNKLLTNREQQGIKLTSESALNDNQKLISQIKEVRDALQDGSVTTEQAVKKLKDFSEQADYIKFDEESYKKEQSALRELQALRDSFYKKNISQIDAEIAERERLAAVFSAQIKEQMTAIVNEENQSQKAIKQLNDLIEKQSKFNTVVSNQKTSKINKEIISDNNTLIKSIKGTVSQLENQEISASEAEKQLEKYSNEVKELGTRFETSGAKGQSFIKKVFDKANWLGAFYVVNELKNGFINAVEIIKSTEDAVTDLKRVLNDDAISNSKISDELYSIAYEYGRTFDEVSEVSTAFAQAGYDWNDTMELTRGTMLALNTAELDVTQSTQGLIAVLQQWNFTADDYNTVIDKINKTADDFAVTSEDIVSALQRASSSAKNANISFEQTIGIITALAEATGRSGENIGTALNSLIIYTSNTSALEKFAQVGSDAMKQVVADYKRGAKSIYDVWMQLSQEITNLNEQQQEALFQTDDFQNLAETLETELKDVYGAAGTYRQNYFIALLNDMQKAETATKNMADASGYSINENEKYMETLTAQWNQLKSMLSELAVQMGEAGIMDFAKTLVQIGIGAAKATKEFGGLVPLAVTLSGIMLSIKSEQISKNVFTPLLSSIGNAKLQLKLFSMELSSATTISGKFKVALSALPNIFGSLTSAIGLSISAYTVLNSLVERHYQKLEEERKAIIESNNENLEKTNSLKNLYSEYNYLVGQQSLTLTQENEIKDISSQIVDILGDRADALKNLTAGTAEYTNKLNELTKAELESRRTDLKSNVQQYGSQFLSSSQTGGFLGIRTSAARISTKYYGGADEDIASIIENNLKQFEKLGESGAFFSPNSEDEQGLQDYLAALEKTRDELKELGNTSEEMSQKVSGSNIYKKLTEQIEMLSSSFNDYLNAQVQYALNEDLILNGIPKTEEEYENLKNRVLEAVGANEYFNESIETIIDESLPELNNSLNDVKENISDTFTVTQEQIDAVNESFKEFSDTLDSFQSAYNTVNSAISEYNENGYLSLDTIQSIISLGADYVSMLNVTANGITLNENATNNLISMQQENIDQMFRQATAAGLLEIAQKYLADSTDSVGNASSDAQPKVEGLQGDLADLALQAIDAAYSVSAAGDAIAEAFSGTVTGSNFDAMKKEMTDYMSNMNSLWKQTRNTYKDASNWNKSATTTSNAATNAAKSQTDAVKKELEAQKQAVKDRYDAEIDALKEVQDENDRLQKQEEYYRNRKEILNNIEQAKTRSGVEYREQESEEYQKLEELDREWKETVNDWSIEDKIAELEALRDAEVSALDAQIDALENTISNVGTSIVNTGSSANKQLLSNYESDYLDPVSQETQAVYDEVYSQLPELFGDSLDQMLEMVKLNSMQMYNVYNENFFSKMKLSFEEIQKNMVTVQSLTSYNPFSLLNNMKQSTQTQSVVNNNTKNANVFANIYNTSSANAYTKNIFNMP